MSRLHPHSCPSTPLPTHIRGGDRPEPVERRPCPPVAEKPERAVRWESQDRGHDEAAHHTSGPRTAEARCWPWIAQRGNPADTDEHLTPRNRVDRAGPPVQVVSPPDAGGILSPATIQVLDAVVSRLTPSPAHRATAPNSRRPFSVDSPGKRLSLENRYCGKAPPSEGGRSTGAAC